MTDDGLRMTNENRRGGACPLPFFMVGQTFLWLCKAFLSDTGEQARCLFHQTVSRLA